MKKGRIDAATIEAKGATIGTATINTVTYGSTYYKTIDINGGDFYEGSTETAYYEIALASTGVLSTAAGLKAWAFDATKSEALAFQLTMPTDYKEGTDITPYLHVFSTSSTGSTALQNIKLIYSYMWTNQDTAFASTATETYVAISSTISTGMSQGTTNFTAMTGTGKEVGSIINGYIARVSTSSTDTWTKDFWLNGMSFYYEVDTVGSTSTISDK
jgi:hypothetical protein